MPPSPSPPTAHPRTARPQAAAQEDAAGPEQQGRGCENAIVERAGSAEEQVLPATDVGPHPAAPGPAAGIAAACPEHAPTPGGGGMRHGKTSGARTVSTTKAVRGCVVLLSAPESFHVRGRALPGFQGPSLAKSGLHSADFGAILAVLADCVWGIDCPI